MIVDTKHGIITGVDCYPANKRESDIILRHLKDQPCSYKEIALDGIVPRFFRKYNFSRSVGDSQLTM